MRGVNRVTLVGNLGKDPEGRYTKSGTAVTTLSIATTEKWTKDGTPQEKTTWHRVVCWDKLADVAAKYLSKGRQVYIEGRIDYRTWDDDKGNKRHTTEIVANQLVMLGTKQEGRSLEDQIFNGGEQEDEVPF